MHAARNPQIDRLALYALAALLLAAPSSAQRRAPEPASNAQRSTAVHPVLALARDEARMLRAIGADYTALRQLRVVTDVDGRAVPARGVTARIGRVARGGRSVELRASAEAAPGTYRVEGLVGRDVHLVLPVVLEVSAAPVGAAPRGAPPGRAVAPAPGRVPAVTTAPRAAEASAVRRVTPRAERYLELPLESVPVPGGGAPLKSIPGMEHRGPGAAGTGSNGSLLGTVSPNTSVSHVVPEQQGVVGGTVELHGQALPHQGLEVRLGATLLTLVSTTPTKVVARLPAAPMSGALVLVRTSDGAAATLADPYDVVVASAPKAFSTFDTAATQNSWTNAYLLSLLAWIAYAPEAVVDKQASAWGLSLSKPVIQKTTWFFADPASGGATGSTTAYVLYDATRVIVTFRGSTTDDWAQDWVDNDLDLLPLPYLPWGTGVVLHHGFHEAMAIAYEDVRARITPLLPGRKLWLTGHSLGGAVAVLTAFRLEHENAAEVQGIHVFGAPPVGNPELLGAGWAKAYTTRVSNTHRWNIERDPVPSLLAAPAFGHVGVCHNLNTDGSVDLSATTPFFYLPQGTLVDDLMVTHMGYWWRLYDELAERDATLASSLPAPPPSSEW